MKSERNTTNLNNLLSEYMRREPSYTFRVKTEDKRMKKRGFNMIKTVAVFSVILFVALVGVGIYSKLPQKNPTDLGFMITAYASDEMSDKGKALGYKVTGLNECGPLVTIEEDALHYDRLTLSITGENIESYDIEAEFGELNFFDTKNRITSENAFDAEVYSYFAKGSKLIDLPPAPVNNPDETQLYWYPDSRRIMAEMDDDQEIFLQQKEKLKSADDFNKYFSDIVTVTVRYTDGKTESAEIDLTFDSKGYVSAVVKSNSDLLTVY